MELNKIYHGDCYELIKQIPDKSIDLIYTDVPYLIENHGKGHSKLANRLSKIDNELSNKDKIKKLEKQIADFKVKMENAKDKDEYEHYHCWRGSLMTKLDLLKKQDITKGFDYSILDEFVRVMKDIYIYISGAVKTKYMIY